jgi:hypothetical protein
VRTFKVNVAATKKSIPLLFAASHVVNTFPNFCKLWHRWPISATINQETLACTAQSKKTALFIVNEDDGVSASPPPASQQPIPTQWAKVSQPEIPSLAGIRCVYQSTCDGDWLRYRIEIIDSMDADWQEVGSVWYDVKTLESRFRPFRADHKPYEEAIRSAMENFINYCRKWRRWSVRVVFYASLDFNVSDASVKYAHPWVHEEDEEADRSTPSKPVDVKLAFRSCTNSTIHYVVAVTVNNVATVWSAKFDPSKGEWQTDGPHGIPNEAQLALRDFSKRCQQTGVWKNARYQSTKSGGVQLVEKEPPIKLVTIT